jgi:hypothetical protein
MSRHQWGAWFACSLAVLACGGPEDTSAEGTGSAGAENDAGMGGIATGGGGGSGGTAVMGGSGAGGKAVDGGSGGAGTAGVGGTGGTGGTKVTGTPPTCVTPPPSPTPRPVKIDLLIMIDNSSSMADKQEIVALAIPDLVGRLVDPVCVDPVTRAQLGVRSLNGTCNTGVVDFVPVQDIHIGIITSSLGGHGSTGICDQPDARKTFPHNDDRGHLVARTSMDGAVATFQNKGFLNWNPAGGGAKTVQEITTPFSSMVSGVGQHGCGYEAPLEAIYRFLIDPAPYDTITVDNTVGPGSAVLNGVDIALVQQRADFLRPDSLVGVIAVTDENDCSIIDGGQNFYAIAASSGFPAKSVLTHGTSACLQNPNDRCCVSCLQTTPAGCPPKDNDPECLAGAWLKTEDPENLRCFHQKKRYGIDFLYPVQRYIDGFTKTVIPDRNGTPSPNPLYSDLQCAGGIGCAPTRPKNLVFLAGIVGVPWQDIAVDPNDLTHGYKTGKQLSDQNVWAKILGDPDNPAGPVLPTDPHMIESITPRAGLPGPDSAANADPINGHEWDTSKDSPPNRDLQYACVFNILQPKTCNDSSDCDCASPSVAMVADAKNPVCQAPGTNLYSNLQTRAKAYPGLRELQVLKGIGDQAIVASICPANATDALRADYAFRPAMSALLREVGISIKTCF